MKYDYPFDPDEKNNTAAAIYAVARDGGERVLDLGSGPAIVSRVLASVDGRHVTALDIDEEALAEAAASGDQETLTGDLESPDWHEKLAGRSWDTVILADVLEHLRDPARLLREIRQSELLADGGRIVVSIPNAAHQAIVGELLLGDFRYTDTGLLDDTHIKWFTLASIARLLDTQGLQIKEVHRTVATLEESPYAHRARLLSRTARAALDELGLEGLTYQYVLLVQPWDQAGALSVLEDRLDEALRDAGLQEARARSLEGQLAGSAQAREEDQQTIAEIRERLSELERTRAVSAQEEQQNRAYKQRLDRILASRSYRAARLMGRIRRPLAVGRSKKPLVPR